MQRAKWKTHVCDAAAKSARVSRMVAVGRGGESANINCGDRCARHRRLQQRRRRWWPRKCVTAAVAFFEQRALLRRQSHRVPSSGDGGGGSGGGGGGGRQPFRRLVNKLCT